MKINFGRVLLGGLVAGLVLNIGEFVLNEIVLKKQMEVYVAAHNFATPPASFLPVAIGLTFVLGIVFVWSYALVRPRLGPGVKAAAIVGLIAWFGICFYVGIIYAMLFAIPTDVMAISIAWGLVEYILGAIAGAWLYKEA